MTSYEIEGDQSLKGTLVPLPHELAKKLLSIIQQWYLRI